MLSEVVFYSSLNPSRTLRNRHMFGVRTVLYTPLLIFEICSAEFSINANSLFSWLSITLRPTTMFAVYLRIWKLHMLAKSGKLWGCIFIIHISSMLQSAPLAANWNLLIARANMNCCTRNSGNYNENEFSEQRLKFSSAASLLCALSLSLSAFISYLFPTLSHFSIGVLPPKIFPFASSVFPLLHFSGHHLTRSRSDPFNFVGVFHLAICIVQGLLDGGL